MKYKYALIRSLIGSGNSTVSKLVMMYLPVYPVLLVRYFGGFLISIYGKNTRSEIFEDVKFLRKDKKTNFMFVMSLILTGINVLVFYYIINNFPLTISSIFVNGAYVVISVILGRFVLGEIKSKTTYVYITLAVLALVVYIMTGNNENVSISAAGIILMLINAVGSSVETMLSALNLRKLKSSTVVTGKMVSNAAVAIIFLLITGQKFSVMMENLTIMLFLGLLFLVFSGVFVKVLEYKSIKIIGTGETAVFGILSYVFGAIISMIVFEEWLSIYQYVALVMIVLALYLIQREDLKRKRMI